ncbi:MAG: DNA cytosine methyltransferase [bacterium]|nr:DNA cytosine methyltransferase [bacterium]
MAFDQASFLDTIGVEEPPPEVDSGGDADFDAAAFLDTVGTTDEPAEAQFTPAPDFDDADFLDTVAPEAPPKPPGPLRARLNRRLRGLPPERAQERAPTPVSTPPAPSPPPQPTVSTPTVTPTDAGAGAPSIGDEIRAMPGAIRAKAGEIASELGELTPGELRRDVEAAGDELVKGVARGLPITWAGLIDATAQAMETGVAPPLLGVKQTQRFINKQLGIDKLTGAAADKMRAFADKLRDVTQTEFLAADSTFTKAPVSTAFGQVGEAAPLYTAAIASSILTKNPWFGAGLFGLIEGGDTFSQARKKGKSITESEALANLNSIWTTVTEFMGLKHVPGVKGALRKSAAKMVKEAVKSKGRQIAESGFAEGVQEFIQTFGSTLINEFGIERSKTLLDMFVEAVAAGGVGAVLGTGAGAVTGSGNTSARLNTREGKKDVVFSFTQGQIDEGLVNAPDQAPAQAGGDILDVGRASGRVDERERIVAASLRDPTTGEVFTGATHGHANPRDRGRLDLDKASDPQEHIGYVTNNGRWVGQAEALERWGIDGSESSAAYLEDPETKESYLGRGPDPLVHPLTEQEFQAELTKRRQAEAQRATEFTPTPAPPPALPDGGAQGGEKRIATSFSGGGTLEAALEGVQSVHAVEFEPDIIQHFNLAHGTDNQARSVLDVSPAEVRASGADHYHASPVCKNFSKAKRVQGAEPLDRECAQAVADVVEQAAPPKVTVENVPAYADTALFKLITDSLDRGGYTWDVVIHDAADYGAPQHRKRMLLRASRVGPLPALPPKTGGGDWFPVVQDLIDDAPTEVLPRWETARIAAMVARGKLDPSKPILTMGGSAGKSVAAAVNAGEPSLTLKATPKEVPRILLPDGTVKRVTPRMMARLMGLPDSYPVPDTHKLAKTVLGNGIHGEVTRQLIQPLIDQSTPTEATDATRAQEQEQAGVAVPDVAEVGVDTGAEGQVEAGVEEVPSEGGAGVAPGMVRVYRAGSGDWFTPDLDTARFHRQNKRAAGEAAELTYVDVPEVDTRPGGKYDAFEHPEVLSGRREQAEAHDVILPREIIDTAKTLPSDTTTISDIDVNDPRLYGEGELTYTGKPSQTGGPIDVIYTDDGRLLVEDGWHRIEDARARGDTTISAVVVNEDGTPRTVPPTQPQTQARTGVEERARAGAEGVTPESLGKRFGIEVIQTADSAFGEWRGDHAEVTTDTTPEKYSAANWVGGGDFISIRDYPANVISAAHEVAHGLFSRDPAAGQRALALVKDVGVPDDVAFESLVDLGGLWLLEPSRITHPSLQGVIGGWLGAHAAPSQFLHVSPTQSPDIRATPEASGGVFLTTDHEYARLFAERHRASGKTPRIHTVETTFERVLDLRGLHEDTTFDILRQASEAAGVNVTQEAPISHRTEIYKLLVRLFPDIRNAGYDAVAFRDDLELGQSRVIGDSYVSLRPLSSTPAPTRALTGESVPAQVPIVTRDVIQKDIDDLEQAVKDETDPRLKELLAEKVRFAKVRKAEVDPVLRRDTSADAIDEEVREAQRGAVTVPEDTPGRIKQLVSRFTGIFSTEAPFRAIGAKETGFDLKVLMSRYAAADERALAAVRDLNKVITSPADDAEIFFSTTNPERLARLPAETRERIQPAVDAINKANEQYGKELKEWGVLKDLWPQSAINRISNEIDALMEEAKKIGDGKGAIDGTPRRGLSEETEIRAEDTRLQKIEEEIARRSADIEKLKTLRFLHFPSRIWLKEKFDSDPESFRTVLSGNFSGIKGRRTIDPFDLVEAGILDPQKVSAREAFAMYTRYVERQRAQKMIRDSAEREGLVKKIADAPEDWVRMDERFPMFAGRKIHPMFAEFLTMNLAGDQGNTAIRRVFASVKMFQFYNPIIMPMYDTYQAFAVTQGRFARPKYIKRAWQSSMGKDDEYWLAHDNGLFSQPYANPFTEFKADMDRQMAATGLRDRIVFQAKRLRINPLRAFNDIYTASWNLAWVGDRILRLQSYHVLRDMGMSPREAAQTAAEAHADYAGVPVRTRKVANMILFTPTFQISMLKWHTKMLMSVARAPLKASAKLAGWNVDSPGKREWVRMASLITAAGALHASDYIMRMLLGWDREQYGRKYKKTITDSRGDDKEVVVSFANPLNVSLKYYYQFVKGYPGTTKLQQIGRFGQFSLHPIPRLVLQAAQNRKGNGEQIVNPFDPGAKQLFDFSRYVAGQIFGLYRGIIAEGEDSKREAVNELKRAEKNPYSELLSLVAFFYMRDSEDIRLKRRAQVLMAQFTSSFQDRPPKTQRDLQTKYNNLLKALDSLEDEADSEEIKRTVKQTRERALSHQAIASGILEESGEFGVEEIERFREEKAKSRSTARPAGRARRGGSGGRPKRKRAASATPARPSELFGPGAPAPVASSGLFANVA